MKQIVALHLAVFLTAMITGCSQQAEDISDGEDRVAPAADEEKVALIVTPRKKTWKLGETMYFDVKVKNPTPNRIDLPFIYDSEIEIDGKLYTQFPKPRKVGNPKRFIKARTEAHAGILTLGRLPSTVDAKTGKIPLKLTAGKHRLFLISGLYKSNAVTFEIIMPAPKDISDAKDLKPFVGKRVIVRGKVTNTKCPYINGIDMWELDEHRGKIVEATGILESWTVTQEDIRKKEKEFGGAFAHRGAGTFFKLKDMKFKVIAE